MICEATDMNTCCNTIAHNLPRELGTQARESRGGVDGAAAEEQQGEDSKWDERAKKKAAGLLRELGPHPTENDGGAKHAETAAAMVEPARASRTKKRR